MKHKLITLVGVATSVVLGNVSRAQSDDPTEVPDHSLSEWKLGDIISADQLKLDDLAEKVVAIEYWEINLGGSSSARAPVLVHPASRAMRYTKVAGERLRITCMARKSAIRCYAL